MAPWNGFIAAAILAALAQPIGLLAAQPDAQRQAEIAALVADLGHQEFGRRELAVERLVLAEADAFEPLLTAAQDENTEIAWRATSALTQISSKLGGERLQQSLESLAKVDTGRHPHLATVIADLQARARNDKHAQALAKIRALGGTTEDPDQSKERPAIQPLNVLPLVAPVAPPAAVKLTDVKFLPAAAVIDVSVPADALGEPAPPPDFLPTALPGEIPAMQGEIANAFVGEAEIGGNGPAVPENVTQNPAPRLWLTSKWRGGDEGLVHLKELTELSELGLIDANVTDEGLKHVGELPNLDYLTVRGTRITSGGLRQLRSQRQTLIIKAVGRTKIGISAEIDGDRCRVATVNPGSAAETAGIRVGDYVLRADGAEVTSFVDLMIATFDRAPGHMLQLELERNGEKQTAVVELAQR